MTELTPAEKRQQTMIKKYGADWREKIGKKAAKTYKERFTVDQRKAIASNAGKKGGPLSPTKFKPGDERAVRYGKLSKKHAESVSESTE